MPARNAPVPSGFAEARTTAEPDKHYRWRLLALASAMLLPSLGTSIANVALPALASEFGASFRDVQWVVISYLLAVTTLIVGAGRLGDMLGRRRLLLTGIALFSLASVACALAPSLWVLVVARAAQGAGAAFMMALTIAAVGDSVPSERTGSAIGLLGTVSAVGTALGPSFGGILITWLGWPAVFGFMALAGLAAFLIGLRLFAPDPASDARRSTFDLPGFVLLVMALGAYALSTTLGGATSTIACIAVAVAALGLFVIVELHAAAPLVNVRQLRNASLSAELLAMGLVSTIVMATLVIGPFYLSEVEGLSVVYVGLAMSVGPIVAALVGVPAGRLVDRWGSFVIQVTGLSAVVTGCVLMVILPLLLDLGGYLGSLMLITGGYALFQAANNTSIMKVAASGQRGVISALLGLSRNLGLVTGASAMGAIFAAGSRGLPWAGLDAGGLAGMQATFSIAAVLAALGLWLAFVARHDSKM
ncbi:MAG: MFS transporter [Devosia sp.]